MPAVAPAPQPRAHPDPRVMVRRGEPREVLVTSGTVRGTMIAPFGAVETGGTPMPRHACALARAVPVRRVSPIPAASGCGGDGGPRTRARRPTPTSRTGTSAWKRTTTPRTAGGAEADAPVEVLPDTPPMPTRPPKRRRMRTPSRKPTRNPRPTPSQRPMPSPRQTPLADADAEGGAEDAPTDEGPEARSRARGARTPTA